MGEPAAIIAEGLTRRFGQVPALSGADLEVPAHRTPGQPELGAGHRQPA